MRKIIIPIFVPHKGCPHDCVFCNQKKISGQIKTPSEDEIRDIIKKYLNGIDDEADVEIAFYGGSFTGIEYELQERFLSVANEFFKNNDFSHRLSGIRASTRPDCIDDKIISLLIKYNVKTIELGVQSLDSEVLIKSGRGHAPEDVYIAVDLLKKAGIKVGIQTMIGLPGDTKEKAIDTCNKVIEMDPDIVRIYPTLVIKDTYLSQMYNKGEYTPLTLEEAIDLSSYLLEKYYDNDINVIRVGLLSTDNIKDEQAGGDVLAGPMHPSFRQLAESRIAKRRIFSEIENRRLFDREEICILADVYDKSVIIGQRKSNINEIKNKFNINKITVISRREFVGQSYDFML